ncbi:MAG: hypothetical protein O7B25_09160 [Gammaproteobacteria bacterium]|nr:hypothetical protein [Gammaproteobacteria bacterium]
MSIGRPRGLQFKQLAASIGAAEYARHAEQFAVNAESTQQFTIQPGIARHAQSAQLTIHARLAGYAQSTQFAKLTG